MKFVILIALLATVAYSTRMETQMNTGGQAGSAGMESQTKLDDKLGHQSDAQANIHSMGKRAEMETKMSSGPGSEVNTQMDTGDQQMSAQAETHNRARRWGYYGGYGGMGYGGMGWGRPWGMGMYGMRGMGYGYPMWG
ncbi:hypothetical protein B9Z55_003251 [Caenorhabditis nigoni]|uniref:Uncharacterized protein n=1 Tax=Caenorhabditis nigoni TaxID=1611254 RepID=A0A2G5VPB7_9PELO|nr:hypothetical protein B9Z55_003251 [Caenorhabditis nigoni]